MRGVFSRHLRMGRSMYDMNIVGTFLVRETALVAMEIRSSFEGHRRVQLSLFESLLNFRFKHPPLRTFEAPRFKFGSTTQRSTQVDRYEASVDE